LGLPNIKGTKNGTFVLAEATEVTENNPDPQNDRDSEIPQAALGMSASTPAMIT